MVAASGGEGGICVETLSLRDTSPLLSYKPANVEFAENARDSLLYSLVQAPLTGVTQLVDKSVGSELLSKVQIFAAPKAAEFGTSAWAGQVLGGTVGSAAPFIAMHRMIGPGAAAKLEATSSYGLGRAALPHIAKSMLVGAAYSAICQPVADQDGDFWKARMANATVGGVTAGMLTFTSIGLKSTGVATLNNDIVAGAISGVPAGLVSANLHSLMAGKGAATATENFQSVATFSLGGAFLGASNIIHERIAPTTGIGGVRTVEDMRKLADSTRSHDFESRNALMVAAERGNRPYGFLPGKPNRVADQVLSSLAESQLTPKLKQEIASGHQDLLTSLEAIKDVGYTVTIYGSARIGPERLEYQRTRYLAGMLAKEEMAVMTGGGVSIEKRRGIMDAGNRGAFEAGGESIGVSIALPFEAAANPFQTIKLIHQDYFTRKQVLRKANAYVVEEGGLGTVDEAMELLCHIQTKKQDAAPVYFVGSQTYGPLVKALDHLVARGLMCPADMKLFKVVNDPRQIVQELVKHRAGLEFGAGIPKKAGFTSVPADVPVLRANR